MVENNSNPSQKYVIAIDVGTSSTKVGLVNQDGKVVAKASGRYETYFLPGGGAEQDPNEWWQVICNGVPYVVRESGVSAEDIIAIGTTSQWAVSVPVDEQGEPLMNAISWMDRRGGKYIAEIVKGFPSLDGYGAAKLFKWINIAGFPPFLEGTDTTAHNLYIKYERPDIYRRTFKFLEPMDFVNMRLTGRACATASSNIGCLLIDNRTKGTGDYNPWALKLSGLDRSKLPDLLPVEGVVGNLQPKVASEWGLSSKTVVITSANDNCVAPIGSGAIADFDAVAVLGTSGMLVFHYPGKKTDVFHSLVTLPSALKGRNIFSADTGNTGKAVDSFLYKLIFCKDEFTSNNVPEDIYSRLDEAVERIPPGSEGILFMPWINGGGFAPSSDQYLRGGFINLTHDTTRCHLARAVLEGIAYNWRWLVESATTFSKRKFPFLRLTGGGANSDVWAQIMADVLGIPIHQEENPSDNTLLGIAFLAFMRVGLMSLEDIPGKVRTKRVYEPNPDNKEIYDHMYRQFRSCTKNLKPVFNALNKTA